MQWRRKQGGAHRLEIVRHLDGGGLTPTELVRQLRTRVYIPVRVMLRENAGFEMAGQAEFDKLCTSAQAFAAMGFDGIVIGFLRDGYADVETIAMVLACALGVKSTFHRAFEQVGDAGRTIAALKASGFDRILTSGTSKHLRSLSQRAAPEITIITGGGLDARAMQAPIGTTDIREFHVGRPARFCGSIDQLVDAERVRQLVQRLET